MTYKLVVSPMAGLTDAPFRKVAIQYGADYGISEMITSQTHLWDSNKTQQRLKSNFNEPKRIIQIAGASPDIIAEAAHNCGHENIDAIEINMGCPAKKVCNVLAGSALLRDEQLVADILSSAVNAVDVPIYLKTRLGWDHENKNILTIAKIAEDVGVKSLTIHGRTRSDMYNGAASYDLIAEVKTKLSIPVFANGDINDINKAKEVLEYTKADGLYIGRGGLGRPWLFKQIKDYLSGQQIFVPSKPEVLSIMLIHIADIYQHYGEYMGVRFARKHIKWYLEANQELFGSSKEIFTRIVALESTVEQLEFIHNMII